MASNSGTSSGDELPSSTSNVPSVPGALESFPTQFRSWEELEQFVDEFGASTFQVFRKRTSVTAAMRNSAIAKRVAARSGTRRAGPRALPIPEALRFYAKTYACTHGLKNTPRGVGRRTHAAIRDTGCTARIHATLRFSATVRTYVVTTRVSGTHNHPVGRAQYFSYAENRRIADPALLRDVAAMAANGDAPRTILAHLARRVHETTGEECVYKLKDIHNVLARLKNDNKMLLTSGQADADASSAVADSAESAGPTVAVEAGGSDASQATLVIGQFDTPEAAVASAAPPVRDAVSDAAAVPRASRGSLSRLEILLGSIYTYHSAHAEVNSLPVVATELIENTISGLKFEVVQLDATTFVRDDVDFVLPKHAIVGCENGIVAFCNARGLAPQTHGATLPVTLPGPYGKRWVATVSSRQLLTMKQLFQARYDVAEAKKAIEWVDATCFSAFPATPFDEYSGYSKELFVQALELMPLTKVVVRGRSSSANAPTVEFTDTIYCASLLKLCSDANIDTECMKAVLLRLHAHFNATVGFVNPSFALEAHPRERGHIASSYGAFTHVKAFVAGVAQLPSGRWGGFCLDCAKTVCYLCAPTAAEREELEATLAALFFEFRVTAAFEASPSPPASAAASDSGVLALLFVECMLRNATWGDSPVDSFASFRVRYLLQAIQVVVKQDVHDAALGFFA